VRHLAPSQSYPSALAKVNSTGRSAIDWNVCAMQEFGIEEIVFVGGYHIEKVVHKYPFFRFYYHKNWENESDIQGLAVAQSEIDESVFIMESDIVFRSEALQALCGFNKDEIVIGCVDRVFLSEEAKAEWMEIRNRLKLYRKNVVADEYLAISSQAFAGMIYVPYGKAKQFVEVVQRLSLSRKDISLLHLSHDLINKHEPIQSVRIDEHWSSLADSLSLARFVLGTKAQTLDRLERLVNRSIIPSQIKFTVGEWKNRPDVLVSDIKRSCGKGLIVVRSSAIGEDSWNSSEAGKFHSELNVDGSDSTAVAIAVENVIQSYVRAGRTNNDNEILIQPQVSDVKVNGVLFTKDLTNRSPYYIINYDKSTQNTDTITSGRKGNVNTKVVLRKHGNPVDGGWCDNLILAAREIEELLAFDSLDIEFAINNHGVIYFLQIRPLADVSQEQYASENDFYSEVDSIRQFLEVRLKQSPFVHGDINILSEMSDWNPAEMIGSNPRPLALSLYQKLITDRAWAQARWSCGYKDIRPEALMVSLGGKPYIDVRNSFNSFVPANLSSKLTNKLVKHCLRYLKAHPECHDKVEFEVMPTCYSFDFEIIERRLLNDRFTSTEIRQIGKCFKELTDNIIRNAEMSIAKLLGQFKMLDTKREKTATFEISSPLNEIPWQINSLVNNCVEYGTIPFSILARYGFIALIMLRSLVSRGVFTEHEYEKFLANISTIASQIKQDLHLFESGMLGKTLFVKRYGHLRPNSYDICSSNYEMMVSSGVLCHGKTEQREIGDEANESLAWNIWKRKKRDLSDILRQNGFESSADQLFYFIKQSLAAREQGKFEFTKNVNMILEKTALFGSALGFSREEISFVSIENIMRLATDSPSSITRTEFQRIINYEKKRHNLTISLRMPALIDAPESIESFEVLRSQPTFITMKKVFGAVADLSHKKMTTDLKGKIICIESADPGYDWIFSKFIAGLITKYGGSGSHMAIRAAEFGIPAAIGCGEIIFDDIRKAKSIELNCESQIIRKM